MKKISLVLLCVLICLAFCSCTNKNADKAEVSKATHIETVTIYKNTDTTASSASAEKDSTVKSTVKSTTVTTHSKKQKTTATAKATTEKKNGKKPTSKNVTATSKAVVNNEKTSTVSENISCVVYVECSSILDNMQDLKAGHEAYVPQNGIIMSSTSVTLKSSATAYDAVKLACEKQGVSMNVSSSSYGKYIAGFNNIDEKDCGRESGWKYKVNGTYPSKSCDKYILKDGDRIEFTYVCNYR